MTRALCLVALLSLLANAGQLWRAQVVAGHSAIELASIKAERDSAVLAQQAKQIADLVTINARHDQLQAQAREAVAAIGTLATQRGQHYERIERENQAFRMWGDARLPVDLARLRERPELNSADDYRRWLSESGGMPPAAQQSDPEPGSAPRP